MSIIRYYVRLRPEQLEAVLTDPDDVFGEARAPGIEVIDIDRAYEGLSWLLSPLKRAEMEHSYHLLADEEWTRKEARNTVERLRGLPVDEELAAIEGSPSGLLEAPGLGLAATYAGPGRVAEMAAALSRVTEERLRGNFDLEAMDRVQVVPGRWLVEGEDNFTTYLLPGLRRLQAFYIRAAEAGQGMLIVAR